MSQMQINLIINFLGVVISALASICVAKKTSDTEIKKAKVNWEQQHSCSADAVMQTALSAAALCACGDPLLYRDQALSSIAPLLCAYSGKLGDAIQCLYNAIADSNWDMAKSIIPEVGRLYSRRQNRILRLIDQFSRQPRNPMRG